MNMFSVMHTHMCVCVCALAGIELAIIVGSLHADIVILLQLHA